MDIIKLARELGAAIQKDERYLKYEIARQNNEEDEALQELIREFNLQRMSLNNEVSKDDKDEEKIKAINAAVRSAYDDIMQNPNMQAYNLNKTELDTMVNNITAILSLCVNGEDPETCEPASGCGDGCASCSGCH